MTPGRSYNPAEFPPEIQAYFSLKFPPNLWQLGGEVFLEPITTFVWQLDCPFWRVKKGDAYNLKPREVLTHPEVHREHWDRIQSADMSYTVIVAEFEGTLVILDGLHRLAKIWSESAGGEPLTNIRCRRVDHRQFAPRSIEQRTN